MGKFTQSFTKKDCEAKWNKIALSLNAIPGGVKTGVDWKRVSVNNTDICSILFQYL